MKRVVAQGDLRPMAGNTEAMDDLKRILAGREAFYAKADLTFDTSGKSLADAYCELRAVDPALRVPPDVGARGRRYAIYCLTMTLLHYHAFSCYAPFRRVSGESHAR